jgi:beta-aspartyl-peptidase (threonine type)
MEKSQHVMMVGAGAEDFARSQHLEMVEHGYFFTQERWDQLQKVKQQDDDQVVLDHDSKRLSDSVKQPQNKDNKYGTVGAVALDLNGNLAAATSTGGMTNKKFGRVGDSPVIGAGTYADNQTCAVSCTGWGEYFLRTVAAKTICDLMEFRNCSLQEATEELIFKRIPELGGDGGLIAIDRQGNISMPFNTEGMYRGFITQDGKVVVKIYKE